MAPPSTRGPNQAWHIDAAVIVAQTLYTTAGRGREEIPFGTLDMLILKTLSGAREMHGFSIADSSEEHTESVPSVEEGSVYPALQRLLMNGSVTAEWSRPDGDRRTRCYCLTPAGCQQLGFEIDRYYRLTSVIGHILQPS